MTWTQTSATQHDAFKNHCQRFWYFRWVDRLPVPRSPQQQWGIDLHQAVETYLNTGSKDAFPGYTPFVDALAEYLPSPQSAALLVEHRFELGLPDGLPIWVGQVDVAHAPEGAVPQIDDVKSCSSFRWAKTPGELFDSDVQTLSYAQWVRSFGYRGPVDVRLLYVQRPKGPTPRRPKVKVVSARLSEEHSRERWTGELAVVRQMREAATAASALELPPNWSSCTKYGGPCPFAGRCGPPPATSSVFGQRKGKDMSSFLDKLRGLKPASTTPASTTPASTTPASTTPASTTSASTGAQQDLPGILPPDAPSREYTAADQEADAQVRKRRGRPPKSTPTVSTAPTAPTAPALVLYIDCGPIRPGDFVLFDDWVQPIQERLRMVAQEEKGVAHPMFLAFGDQKGLFALVMEEYRSKSPLPPSMVLMTDGPVARDAIELLVPHYGLVVRARR